MSATVYAKRLLTVRRTALRTRALKPLIVVVAFCVLGVTMLAINHAATVASNAEAESGSVASPAQVVSGSGASAGSAVRFGGTDSTASLNLPRTPWSGGPSFYNSFARAKAFGWTSPSFFPLAEWLPCTNDTSELDKDMRAGINVSVGLCIGGNYSLLRSKGMSVFAEGVASGQGDETVGYFLDDEVDGRLGYGYGPASADYSKCVPDVEPLHCGYTVMAHWNTVYPKNTTTMRYANYTGGVSFGDDDAAAGFLDNFQDVTSVDNYFYSGAGNTCYVSRVAGYVPAGRCPRAANYGTVMRHLQAVDAKNGTYQPLWNFIELGRTGNEPGITPDQAVGAAWSSIINGAMGIIYFIEGTGNGPCGMPGNILRDSCSESAAVTAAITVGNAQIKSLAPVLNTQSYTYSFNSGLDTMLKSYNGSYYIFSMLGQNSDPGSYNYVLPPGMNGTTVQVVDENRTIPIVNGTFSDSFAAEYTHHIYKITP